jgi:hypothetical protein
MPKISRPGDVSAAACARMAYTSSTVPADRKSTAVSFKPVQVK